MNLKKCNRPSKNNYKSYNIWAMGIPEGEQKSE